VKYKKDNIQKEIMRKAIKSVMKEWVKGIEMNATFMMGYTVRK